MFPRLRQQLLARVDLVVEFSTLGEYGINEHGSVMRLDPEPSAARLAPRVRDRCGSGVAKPSAHGVPARS
jgi:hypothetical protein